MTNDIPIELYGARTGNCLRVSIALEEAALPYVVRRVDLRRGEQRRPQHLVLNPMGQVPTVVVNGCADRQHRIRDFRSKVADKKRQGS
jgi:hypothetical protein